MNLFHVSSRKTKQIHVPTVYQFLITCIMMLSASIPLCKIDSPIFIWRAAMTRLTQTPNKEHIIVMISIKSPIQPNMQSPISGYTQDFMVRGSFSRWHIILKSNPTREYIIHGCIPAKSNIV